MASLLMIMLGGCIHEYPVPVNSPSKGNDPSLWDAFIDVDFEISWQSMLHRVDFTRRAREERRHHFIIEISGQEGLVCCDQELLSDDEFAAGTLHHKISSPLGKKKYDIAVWYELQDENGNYSFLTDDLGNVRLTNTDTTDAEVLQSGYASDTLDLGEIDSSADTFYYKRLDLKCAGARFEIIATDVNQFISEQKEALLQGDWFKVSLELGQEGSRYFNVYRGQTVATDSFLELSGRMRLPYSDYEELKIAEGFLFCDSETEVEMQLSVVNSALVTVSRTDYFTFPIKRGYITTVRGDFLTHPLGGVFNIDNIWGGEIVIEI